MPDTLEAPQTERPPSPAMADFDATFADLESPTPQTTPNESSPAPETTTQAKDPTTGQFTKATEKPVSVAAKGPEESAKPSTEVVKEASKVVPQTAGHEFSPPQVAKPSELRGWAQKMGSRAEKAEQQLVQLNRQIQELRSQPQQNHDVQATVAELAATKKRYEEAQAELKATRYERSEEYKEKYEKPYQNAWQSAYNVVGELLVNYPDPTDPERVLERPATKQDFDEIYDLKLGPGSKLAQQKFGPHAAPMVMQHVQGIKDLARAAVASVNDNRGKAQLYDQQQTAQKQMADQGRSMMFNEALGSLSQKYPTLFDKRDGDTAWNDGLSKGRSMADLAYGDRSQLTPQQSVMLDAQIFARVSAFPALKQENVTLKAELEDYKKQLSEIRGSAPGKTAPGAVKTESAENMTLEQAFDKFVP